MAAVTIRNLSEEAHRALKVRAAQHNRSTEAEMRAILEAAVRPEGRLLLGTALSEIVERNTVSPMPISRPSNRSAIRVPPSRSILNDLALRMILLDTNVVSEAIRPRTAPIGRAPGSMPQVDRDAVPLQHHRGRTSLRHRRAAGRQAKGHAGSARSTTCWTCSPPASCRSIRQRRGAMPISPSRRARPERASPRPTAISPRSPPPTGSPSHRATRVRSMPRGLTVIDPWTVTS